MSDSLTSRNPLPDELDSLLRRALRRVMIDRGISEDDLAKELKTQTGLEVNAGLIHAWRADSKHRWHLPAKLVPIICEILGDDSIQLLLLNKKQRRSLKLGEDVPRIVSLLRSALPDATERKNGEGRKKPKRTKR